MRIVVCVKQIRHVYARTGLDPSTHFISAQDAVAIVNPLDEIAVEEAIRWRERNQGGDVVLITLGELVAERGLRHCLAMGADRIVRIHDPSFETMDAWSTATVLSAAINRLRPRADLVLCGKEALDDRRGQVGVLVAELLDLPCVSGIVRLDPGADGTAAVVHRAVERGDREVVECPLPAVFTVERGLNEPRYPSLDRLLEADGAPIEQWDLRDLGLDPGAVQPRQDVVKITPPRPRTRKPRAPASTLPAQARIRMLLGGSEAQTRREDSKLVELPPHEAAKRVLDFLEDHGIL